MAGGPVFPHSVYPVTAGSVFPYVYVGAGANSKHEEALGVAASIGADATWRLRYKIPPSLPTGTAKLHLVALANATTGAAKVTVKDAIVAAAGGNPSAAALTSETQATLTWGAGDNDKYKDVKVTLTPALTINDILVVDLVFNATGFTLAQVSSWIAALIWE